MSTFGTVVSKHYHSEFSYGFIEFATHAQAKAALDGLKNEASLRDIIATVGTDAETAACLSRLFVPAVDVDVEGLCAPSWAGPGPNRKQHH